MNPFTAPCVGLPQRRLSDSVPAERTSEQQCCSKSAASADFVESLESKVRR